MVKASDDNFEPVFNQLLKAEVKVIFQTSTSRKADAPKGINSSTNAVAPFFQKSGKKLSYTSLLAKLLCPSLLNLISENQTAAIEKLVPFELSRSFY
ncbi:5116_t:CDS:2 [Funneliformis mosseae]|uniref:5116_t:CDS:1 n=1 Tax=Funneliformis mosseae TaxID=27381 RepID=A0A9N9EP87_FUNMO|nr:5116_t:CDS:2 [Funneliformis mosseae]